MKNQMMKALLHGAFVGMTGDTTRLTSMRESLLETVAEMDRQEAETGAPRVTVKATTPSA